MKNLANVKNCDETIVAELREADAFILTIPRSVGEVAYTKVGSVSNWLLHREWRYWVARASSPDDGLPLSVAIDMHNKPYDSKDSSELTYGAVIRVKGHSSGTSPKNWPNDAGKIDLYHIDTQEGLNEFVRTVKLLSLSTGNQLKGDPRSLESSFRIVEVCDAIRVHVYCAPAHIGDSRSGGPLVSGYVFYVSPTFSGQEIKDFITSLTVDRNVIIKSIALTICKDFLVENLWDKERIAQCIIDNSLPY